MDRLDLNLSCEQRAIAGDVDAFMQLIRAWDDDLRAVVWSVLRASTAMTDDVMQAAYEKAFRALGNFRQEASMKTWLTRICLTTAIDHSRYERRREHEPLDVLENVTAATRPSSSDAAISRVELAAALEMLVPETRALVMLTLGLGYPFDEVAEIAGLPRGTVASRVGRAKEAIRGAGASIGRGTTL